jgi:hypothetical protein
MSDRPDELPDDVRALLLVAERDAPAAPEGARAMVLDRVFATVSAAPTSDAPSDAAPPPSVAASAGVGIVRFALASLAVVGAVVVTTVAVSRQRAPSDHRPTPRRAATAAPSSPLAPPVAEHTISRTLAPAAPIAVTTVATAPVQPAPRAANARRASEDEAPEDLAAEQRLLAEGQRALARGEADAVLSSVRAHAQRFARGALAEERDALEVRALLLARRDAEARARAERFRRRYPESVFLSAIESRLDER